MKKLNRRSFLKATAGTAVVATATACGAASSSEAASTATSTSDAASSEASASGEAVELSFAWWGSQNRNERTIAACDLYSEQNPNVTFEPILGDWGTYWQKLSTDAAGHNMADIIQQDPTYIKQYIENGLLVPLDEYVESGILDISHINPNLLIGTSHDGKLYGISSGQNGYALAYNKQLLEDNDIAIEPLLTLDAFCKISKEVFDKTGVKTDFYYPTDAKFQEYIIRGAGYSMYNEDGTALGYDDPSVLLPMYETIQKGLDEGWLVGPDVYAGLNIDALDQKPLVSGTTPATTSWCHITMANMTTTLALTAAEKGIELDLTTWPAVDITKSNYITAGMPLCITTDSKNPEEAAKFINYWTNSIECNEILAAERGVPLNDEVATALIPSLEPEQQKFAAHIVDVLNKNSTPAPNAAPEKASEAESIMKSITEQAYYGQISPADAVQQIFDQCNAVLGG